MLFAVNNNNDSLGIYVYFLNKIIEDDNQKFKEIFNPIIEKAHLLAIEKEDFKAVPSDIFDIVSILVINHKEFFKTVDANNINLDTYKKINQYLESDLYEVA